MWGYSVDFWMWLVFKEEWGGAFVRSDVIQLQYSYSITIYILHYLVIVLDLLSYRRKVFTFWKDDGKKI